MCANLTTYAMSWLDNPIDSTTRAAAVGVSRAARECLQRILLTFVISDAVTLYLTLFMLNGASILLRRFLRPAFQTTAFSLSLCLCNSDMKHKPNKSEVGFCGVSVVWSGRCRVSRKGGNAITLVAYEGRENATLEASPPLPHSIHHKRWVFHPDLPFRLISRQQPDYTWTVTSNQFLAINLSKLLRALVTQSSSHSKLCLWSFCCKNSGTVASPEDTDARHPVPG